MTITVIGAGYVGLVTAVLLANVGHKVYCVENNKEKYTLLSQGICYFYEDGLQDELTQAIAKGTIKFMLTAPEAVSQSQAIFLCLPTPNVPHMIADIGILNSVIDEIIPYLPFNSTLIIKSTIPVGTSCRIEHKLKSAIGDKNIHLMMNPEFLRQGNAIFDFKNPFLVVVGYNFGRSSILEQIYENLVNAEYLYVSTSDAEMIKYASNLFLANRISLINELAVLCEKTGADIRLISDAIRRDPNIGDHYLSPGIGYGGSCFHKDIEALIRMGQAVNIHLPLIEAIQSVNNRQKLILVEKAVSRFGKSLEGKRFAVWGLTFKPGTSDIREAPSIDIINQLVMLGADLIVYDPMQKFIQEKTPSLFPVEYASDPYVALESVDALFLLTEWPVFTDIDYSRCVEIMNNPLIFDGRNALDSIEAKRVGIELIQVGVPI